MNNYVIYLMSYNSKDFTEYIYKNLKNQGANIKVLENSGTDEAMFKCDDTIDLGRKNIGMGGFYQYVLNNLSEDMQFYGIFNNDLTDISDNYISELLKNLSSDIGILHSNLNDSPFNKNQAICKRGNSDSYIFIESVAPIYNYKVLLKFKNLLSSKDDYHFYGQLDWLLSNVSNSLNLKNKIVDTCIATHMRSGVRKLDRNNYNDYFRNVDHTYFDFVRRNPNLIPYVKGGTYA